MDILKARRALRALKGLVRLQALVRGHIARKNNAARLQRLQAILRAQARARTGRSQISELSHSRTKSSQFHQPVRKIFLSLQYEFFSNRFELRVVGTIIFQNNLVGFSIHACTFQYRHI